MANTNATIILSVSAFYIFIGAMMGLIGGSYVASAYYTTVPTPSGVSFLTQIGWFFSGIGYSIVGLGWFNIVLFAPLGITLFYIILSYFRGSS